MCKVIINIMAKYRYTLYRGLPLVNLFQRFVSFLQPLAQQQWEATLALTYSLDQFRQWVRRRKIFFSVPLWHFASSACAGRAFQLPDPYPYPMMLTRTRPVPKIATRPDPTRGYTRTRSLPVGLLLLGIIGLVAYPQPGPLHCVSSDESIFCCGEHVLHASSS